jgi:hypothetical protein
MQNQYNGNYPLKIAETFFGKLMLFGDDYSRGLSTFYGSGHLLHPLSAQVKPGRYQRHRRPLGFLTFYIIVGQIGIYDCIGLVFTSYLP